MSIVFASPWMAGSFTPNNVYGYFQTITAAGVNFTLLDRQSWDGPSEYGGQNFFEAYSIGTESAVRDHTVFDGGAVAEGYWQIRFHTPSLLLMGAGVGYEIIGLEDNAGNLILKIVLWQSDGFLHLVPGPGTGLPGATGVTAIAANRHYTLTVWYDSSNAGGVGEAQVWLDDAPEMAMVTSTGAMNAARYSRLGPNHAGMKNDGGAYWRFDYLWVNDTSPSYNTGRPSGNLRAYRWAARPGIAADVDGHGSSIWEVSHMPSCMGNHTPEEVPAIRDDFVPDGFQPVDVWDSALHIVPVNTITHCDSNNLAVAQYQLFKARRDLVVVGNPAIVLVSMSCIAQPGSNNIAPIKGILRDTLGNEDATAPQLWAALAGSGVTIKQGLWLGQWETMPDGTPWTWAGVRDLLFGVLADHTLVPPSGIEGFLDLHSIALEVWYADWANTSDGGDVKMPMTRRPHCMPVVASLGAM